MRYSFAIAIPLSIIIITFLPVTPSAEPEQSICGDVDGNGHRNVYDASFLDNYLWNDGPAPPDFWAANFNGCTTINVADVQHLWDFFWGAPTPQCNLDTLCPTDHFGAVILDTVYGSGQPGLIMTGCQPRFLIRLTNNTSGHVRAITIGFRIYSPDGAVWDTTRCLFAEAFPQGCEGTSTPDCFDAPAYCRSFSADGADADTVGLGARCYFRSGLAIGYDEVGFIVEIGPIPMESVGRTICIDSCWYPPGGDWIWVPIWGGSLAILPTWDGPHCFTVEACCEHRGDVTLSDGLNVSDLTYLIAHLFQGGPGPGCFEAGDIDGDLSGPNISDLTYLVAFLFQGGAPPPGC